MKQQRLTTQRVLALVASQNFFWLITGLLAFQAVWIALSGKYPMAFDEDYHLGIIRLYAHHVSPFWSGQPPGADVFGAVARDPSYLYHWLMSFPYRLFSWFTGDQTIIVLLLRMLNIGLLASALGIFRKLLLMTGASRQLVHGCLLLFVLIPVVPLLAAQINYDNLLLPMVGLLLLIAVRCTDALRPKRPVDVDDLLKLLAVVLSLSIIKYAALPICLVVVVFVVVSLRRRYGSWGQLGRQLAAGWRGLQGTRRWMLVGLVLLLAVLNVERYGVNLVRYHTLTPDCDQVLTVQQCSHYGPWIRDYNFSINKVDEAHNPIVYTGDWLKGMWLRLFFAVGGPDTTFETRGPLVIPGIGAIVLTALTVAAGLVYGRRIVRDHHTPAFWLLLSSAGFYIAVLWLEEYRAYVRTGQPVAINGRYLLPIMLPLLLLGAWSVGKLMHHRRRWQVGLFALAVLTLAWGGGALTFVLRSNDRWYWPVQPVYDANHAVQRVFGPVTPGYRTPTQFLN